MSTSEKRTEQRAVIKFCAMSGMTPTDTWKFLNQKEGVHNCSRTLVFDWHKRFREGQTEITDSARSGRPGNDQRLIQDVKDVIAKDRRKSIDYIPPGFVIELLLTDENKATRVDASREFLRRCDRDGERFLRRIITTDETWVNFYVPESKRESMVWKRPSSPPPQEGENMQAGKESYVVRGDLTNAIRKKRAGCDVENFIFHQDNAPAHRADETLLTIDFLGYERLRHPPYSPDLAPLDFCVFPRLKADLRGRSFDTEDEIKYAVRSAIRSYTPEWYADIYRKWVQRHSKCIEHNGDYFEKA
ncbi:histone-lysine N-methyltransferase SETMAR-like [Ruditapes philippinarum]|uniref:histone-lysine N-methyltransferase SETMAR-like n=1 Tax=Ruditapes philippinarum TaxID=129788 RepID=UPI00295AC160|nr:histone-lysine N-methyltransferase SETMAR-like [Ruditapes philippinarum]